jgi:acrylyl-CoA reductase (NADPH)
MQSFKAFRVHTIDGKPVCRHETLTLDDLDPGAVVIRTAYSSVNYKDAMAARGVGKNVRTERPCVTGIDLSGTVVASEDPRFREGDRVLITNYKLGVDQDGGYAEYARVPGDWIVPLPDGLSLREAMELGSCGLTAALALDRLEKAGVAPESGPVAITGATGGVGSLAVDLFSTRGFEVTAISGKADQVDYLRRIGATEVMPRDELMASKGVLGTMSWAAGFDNVGGPILDRLASRIREHGKVAVCGMVTGFELSTTVLPLVLRSVDFLGINVSRTLHMTERRRLWNRLATDLNPRHLDAITRTITLDDLDGVFDLFVKGRVVGHYLVEIGGE